MLPARKISRSHRSGTVFCAAGFCWLPVRVIPSAKNLPGSEQQPTSLATPSMLAVRKENPLRWFSSSNAIQRRMQESASLWKSIFLDAQLADYGPEGFIGAARIYRAQAWIAQPDQSIQLFGLLDGEPSSVYMLSNGRDYYL